MTTPAARKLRVALVVVLACSLASCDLLRPGRPKLALPNLVLIVIDTARADHFSCYGYPKKTTPHVDALAARGVRFSQVRAIAPWTLPSHMSMFSGLVPRDHGATWAPFSEPETSPLRELAMRGLTPADPERMLPLRLRAAGYQTFGFSPNPWVADSKGFGVGFDVFHELWRDDVRKLLAPKAANDGMENSMSGIAAAGVRKLLAERDDTRPFFVFVNMIDPHFPYEPPEPFLSRLGGSREVVAAQHAGDRRTELAMITGASPFTREQLLPLYDGELAKSDHFVGEMVDALEDDGVLDDTLFMVTSDHGELLGEGGRWSHQLSVGEELLHIPLVVKLPGDSRAGTVIDDPLVSNLDVYATLLAAAGITPPPGLSRDLFALSPPPREFLVSEYDTSRAYLNMLAGINPGFDVAAHAHDLQAVYTPSWRTECVDREPVSTVARDAQAGTSSPDPRSADEKNAIAGEGEAAHVMRTIEEARKHARQTLSAYLDTRDPRASVRVVEPDAAQGTGKGAGNSATN